MHLSPEEVKKISELCRIQLSDEEVERLRGDLSQVLGYIDELNQVNTDQVKPISQVTGLENVFREDVAQYSEIRDEIIKRFPDQKDNYLKIKNIL